LADDNAPCDAFWDWCLSRYDHAGLRELLLTAQDDYDAIVLELMLAAWLAERGYSYDKALRRAAMSSARAWHDQVLIPLRSRRRAWRSTESPALYRHIKLLELQAERTLARLLIQGLLQAGLAPMSPRPAITYAEGFAELEAAAPELAAILPTIARTFDQVSRNLAAGDGGVD
jgi:uncharacterized protein (TIGR02444 family)